MTHDPNPKDGSVLSVRLSAAELSRLREIAARAGVRLSDIIRAAIARYALEGREATVDWGMPKDSRVYMYHGAAPRTQSHNPTGLVSTHGILQVATTTTSSCGQK